ncbi:MAG: HAD family hydrolase [Kineosporiaceae bacterium]
MSQDGDVRMVATDLDGTVVRHDGTLTPRTLAALAACEAAGVDVVFVTGRPPRWMAPIVEATGHAGLAICLNGGVVLDLHTGEVLDVEVIPPVVVLEMAARLRAELPDVAFAVETAHGFGCESGYPRRVSPDVDVTGVPGGSLEALVSGPGIVKLLAKVPAESGITSQHMLDVARPLLAGMGEPVHSDPRGLLLEIGPQGISKATALARLAAQRGISAGEVVAFGDMPNDVPMLSWAGCGYAMADGHPEAIAAAACTAPACDEDGVAQVLETLLARRAG